MSEALTFEIVPEASLVTFGLLQRSLDQLRFLVEEVDFAVTREKVGRLWVVNEIHSTNPTVTVSPMLDSRGVVDVIAEGLQVVTRGESYEPPPGFPIGALERLSKMHGLFENRRERLSRIHCLASSLGEGSIQPSKTASSTIIDRSISAKVDRILARGYSMLGALEGQLDAINLHGALNFTIWDRVSGQPVRCFVDRDVKERVKSLLEKRVVVSGMIRYYSNGLPHQITEIRQIDEVPEDVAGSLAVRFGSIPKGYISGGQDSVAFVKSLRG